MKEAMKVEFVQVGTVLIPPHGRLIALQLNGEDFLLQPKTAERLIKLTGDKLAVIRELDQGGDG